MYYETKIEDTVRISPYRFKDPLEKVAMDTLNESYVGKLDKTLGLFVCVFRIDEISEGKLVIGDGATYHHVTFSAIFFRPEQHEVVEGQVIEIAEFGAFVRIGPMDGLVHVSQVTDDFINYDPKGGSLIASESNKVLTESDKVRARIVTLSLKAKSIKDKKNKIGLTMRQFALGKPEWIQAAKNKGKNKKTKA
ncbi:DNA-directed RNA polymerase [uncultured Methanobrevibacter sp.]|uniref:DNA-directed RNA polymerase n=1 Tax=uncultured Methanobrevibacter sp. TaxID=253161 RepID=UPI0025E2AF38|nr:DNA-directed RNA polymerase [uncultured Methanobrevibacter sp.]